MSTELNVEIPAYLLAKLEAAPTKAAYQEMRERILRKVGPERARRLRRRLEEEKQKGGLDEYDLMLLAMLIGKPVHEMYPGHSPLSVQHDIERGILPQGWTPPKPPSQQPAPLLGDLAGPARFSATSTYESALMTRTPAAERPLNVAKMVVAYLERRMDGGDGSPHARLEGIKMTFGVGLLSFLNSLTYQEAASLVGRDLLSIKRDLARWRADGRVLLAEDASLAGDWQGLALPVPPPEDVPEHGDGGGNAPPPPGGGV